MSYASPVQACDAQCWQLVGCQDHEVSIRCRRIVNIPDPGPLWICSRRPFGQANPVEHKPNSAELIVELHQLRILSLQEAAAVCIYINLQLRTIIHDEEQ